MAPWLRAGFLYLCAIFITVAVFLLAAFPASAQTLESTSQFSEFPTIEQDGVLLPDWSSITFNNLPPIQESGVLQVSPDVVSTLGYDPSRTWEAGMVASEYLKLGDFQGSFNLDSLNLTTIGALTNRDPSQYTLDQYGVVQHQTLDTMVLAVDGLEEYQISEVTPIQDMLSEAGLSGFSDQTIAQFLTSNPEMGQLQFSSIPLENYSIFYGWLSRPSNRNRRNQRNKIFHSGYEAYSTLLKHTFYIQTRVSLARLGVWHAPEYLLLGDASLLCD